MAILICSMARSAIPSDQTLRSIQDVRQLSLRQAGSAISVLLEGVVTWYDPARRFGFIQDETGGVHFVGHHFVEGSPGFDWPPISAGDLLQLRGVTARGNFSPFIGIPANSQDALVVVGTASLPSPIQLPVQRLLNPGNHNQWCELYAIITGIDDAGECTTLELNSGGLQYQATLPLGSDREALKEWLYAEVRVQGVYGALFNIQRQMVGLELFIPAIDFIKPSQTDMGQLFDQRPVSIQELLRFRDQSPERISVHGVVLLQLPGQGFFLRAGELGLWVETNIRTLLQPGEQVKAVGRPTPGELRPYLGQAIIQTGKKGERPKPRRLEPVQALSPNVDGDLVCIAAKLVNCLELPNDSLMLLQAGNITFSARCPGNTLDMPWPELINGSWLELTGVCTVKAAGTWLPADPGLPNRLSRTPASFTLLLGNPSDISILHTPRWWTFERLAFFAAGVALLALSAFLWVALLRRRLRRQTALIADTIQRESIQEERARIARDLHDTLQQNLTGIMHQMNSASKRLLGSSDQVAEPLDLAKCMIRHSLEDVRCTIYNLRSKAVSRADVNAVLQGALEPFLQQTHPEIRFSPFELSCELSSVTQYHLVHIVKEAVNNAVQHAQAHHIRVNLAADTTRFTITVTDDGIGFDAEAVDALKGHFGLLGMRERAGKIRGDLTIHSQLKQGTCVTVTIPLPH